MSEDVKPTVGPKGGTGCPPKPTPGSWPTAKPTFAKPTDEQLKNRFCYHAPKGDQAERYAEIRAQILATAIMCVGLTPCSPEQARALNALDEAMFLFNAAIARTE